MIDIETRRLYAAASIALRYPERDLLQAIEGIESELDNFNPQIKEVLWDLITYFSAKSLMDIQMEYVKTFDRKQRGCLYLSYYLNGDTRKRGMALLDFKGTFASEGWAATPDELDDFLPTLIEFIAVTGSPAGMNLLIEHKAGIALLSIALRDMKSPYAPLVKLLLETIPGDKDHLTLKLIETGPPTEMVGLNPYSGEKSEMSSVGAPC